MKKRQTYSIYQFTWRDLQRSPQKKKKKSHHFPTKKLSRKTISKETNKYETRKRNRETVRHRYTSSSSRSTSGDGKKLSVNFLERERERWVLEREAEAREWVRKGLKKCEVAQSRAWVRGYGWATRGEWLCRLGW